MANSQTKEMYERSPFVQYYHKATTTGRRSLFTSEFADWDRAAQEGTIAEDKGLFLLGIVKYPPIFIESDDEYDVKMIRGILNYICETATSVDGFQDKTLANQAPEYKSTFITSPMFTSISGATKEINISVPAEAAGYGVIQMCNHWMNQIVDEVTGFSNYNGSNLAWSNYAHSCTWIYIKPDQKLEVVRYGALLFQSVPTTALTSNYAGNRSDRGSMSLSIPFTCSLVDSHNVIVRSICEQWLSAYRSLFCIDSSQHGSYQDTVLRMVEDIDIDMSIKDKFYSA